jgi:4-amino-4-deoxychorismate lyase
MTQYPIIHIDGQASGQISALDRGFAYGDGFFETCRAYKNKIHLLDLHLQRLENTAKRLLIPLDLKRLKVGIDNLLHQAPALDNAILKIQITRGVGARGYAFSDTISPTVVLIFAPANILLSQQWLDGVSVRVCNLQISETPALAGLKHLNRLENILARAEWKDEYSEGFLFNQQGHLIEGTMSNIFLIKNGQLLTPDLSRSGVAGVMRENIITKVSSRLDIECHQKNISLIELLKADEIFICNSVIGIWPVIKLQSDVLTSFTAGKITRDLQAALYREYQGNEDNRGDNAVA